MQIATYVTLFLSLSALFVPVCQIRVPYPPAKNRLKFAEHRELSHGGVQHLMLCTNFVLATFRPFPIGKGDNTDGQAGVPKFEVAEGATETLHRHPSLLAAAPVAARQASPCSSAVVGPAAVLADGDVARAPHLAAGLGLARVIDSCRRWPIQPTSISLGLTILDGKLYPPF